MEYEEYKHLIGQHNDPIELLANAAETAKFAGAWRTLMNAIYYLRSGRFNPYRQPGISHDICTGSKVI